MSNTIISLVVTTVMHTSPSAWMDPLVIPVGTMEQCLEFKVEVEDDKAFQETETEGFITTLECKEVKQ